MVPHRQKEGPKIFPLEGDLILESSIYDEPWRTGFVYMVERDKEFFLWQRCRVGKDMKAWNYTEFATIHINVTDNTH